MSKRKIEESKKNKKSRCVVKNCEFLCTDLEFENRNFHEFPRNHEKRQIWLNALKLSEKDVNTKSLVCSNHFSGSDYNLKYLKKNSVPTLNICYEPNNENLMKSHFTNYNFEDEISPIVGE